jgi:signal transduction histidine kinase
LRIDRASRTYVDSSVYPVLILHQIHASRYLKNNAVNLASDDKPLSEKSQSMLGLRDAVFAEWEKRVRASVKEAASIVHPILINTFPALYDNIAEALTPGYPRTSAEVPSTSVASEHGGERARLTDYNIQAVISEYQILRSTLIEVLRKNNVQLSGDDIQIIHSAIDATIKESVTAFALAQAAFREQFVATLAHDLRNPLATANMAAELIMGKTNKEEINKYALQIIENLARMDRMIQDLLDTVIYQSGDRIRLHPSNFDMLELVNEVCAQSAAIHGERFEIQGKAVRGWWGRDAIKRALENLLGNAVKYGTPGTPICVKIDAAYERVLITVHNEGDPIPHEQMEIIFQIFRRAKAAKEGDKRGWGIGLPYVRSVAEGHGGSIGIDSSSERGTSFTMDLPIDSRPFQNAPTLENTAEGQNT